jgi:hypothetical protein
MTANIARPTGAEILPRPPFHRVINPGRKRPQRGVPDPEFPIQRGWRRLAGYRTRAFEPVTLDRAGPIRAKIRVGDLSNAPFLQPAHRRAAVDRRGYLRAELSDHALLNGRLGQCPHLGDIVAQRFLAIDVFAFLHRAVCNGKM